MVKQIGLRKLGKGRGGVLSNDQLSAQIKKKQVAEAMNKITDRLEKHPEIAVHVWAMMENTNFMEEGATDEDLLPHCTNKFSLLSRDTLLKLLFELNKPCADGWQQRITSLKKKSDLLHLAAFAINAEPSCAVPSRSFKTLLLRCRTRMGTIERLAGVPVIMDAAGKPAVDFSQTGVFSLSGLDAVQNRYMTIKHNKSGVEANIPSEMLVGPSFTIANNYSERDAQCKGQRMCDSIPPMVPEAECAQDRDGRGRIRLLVAIERRGDHRALECDPSQGAGCE